VEFEQSFPNIGIVQKIVFPLGLQGGGPGPDLQLIEVGKTLGREDFIVRLATITAKILGIKAYVRPATGVPTIVTILVRHPAMFKQSQKWDHPHSDYMI